MQNPTANGELFFNEILNLKVDAAKEREQEAVSFDCMDAVKEREQEAVSFHHKQNLYQTNASQDKSLTTAYLIKKWYKISKKLYSELFDDMQLTQAIAFLSLFVSKH